MVGASVVESVGAFVGRLVPTVTLINPLCCAIGELVGGKLVEPPCCTRFVGVKVAPPCDTCATIGELLGATEIAELVSVLIDWAAGLCAFVAGYQE